MSWLLLFTLTAALICNPALYGRPSPQECEALIYDNPHFYTRGLESKDRVCHLFADLSRGSGRIDFRSITSNQWRYREALPQAWSNGGCNIVLIPKLRRRGSSPMYDTAYYADIADSAMEVVGECSDNTFLSMSGGRNWAGDNKNLVIVIYRWGSPFWKKVQADIRAGKIIDYVGKRIRVGDGNAEGTSSNALDSSEPSTSDTNRGSVNIPQLWYNSNSQEPKCNAYCSGPAYSCGDGSCRCLAEAWAVPGSGLFKGVCRAVAPTTFDLVRQNGLLEIDDYINDTDIKPVVNRTRLDEIAAKITDVACPCNCTYVSKACCESMAGIVHESLELDLGSLKPPEANLTCSTATGEFEAVDAGSQTNLTSRSLGAAKGGGLP